MNNEIEDYFKSELIWSDKNCHIFYIFACVSCSAFLSSRESEPEETVWCWAGGPIIHLRAPEKRAVSAGKRLTVIYGPCKRLFLSSLSMVKLSFLGVLTQNILELRGWCARAQPVEGSLNFQGEVFCPCYWYIQREMGWILFPPHGRFQHVLRATVRLKMKVLEISNLYSSLFSIHPLNHNFKENY